MWFIVFALPAAAVCAVVWMILGWRREALDSADIPLAVEPFSVSEYLWRMERAQLDILEDQKPVDQAVVLWWGLDGLTLDENGELKWISRKKPEPVNQNVFYQPCQAVLYADNRPVLTVNTCQDTQAAIDALRAQNAALQIQAAQQAQMQGIMMSQLQSCCVGPIWGCGYAATRGSWPN